MSYPEEVWKISLTKICNLQKLYDELGDKAAKAAARKRKWSAAAPSPDVVPADVILDRSVTSQVVTTFSHTEDFLDNLLAHAQS